jgi:ABC-type uncharacterized transport system substrate-binding protein
MMRRSEFISGLGAAAAAWPLAARAQQPAMPVVGVLSGGSPTTDPRPGIAGIFKGLNEMGYVEGRNVTIELREARGQYDRLPALAGELVRRQVTAMFATPSNAAQAAKAATATIPIVFTTGGDPVQLGLVTSLSRPGGNLTGVSFYTGALAPKRLELLRELVPHAGIIGCLANPTSLNSEADTTNLRAAARSVGQEIMVLNASTTDEIEAAFATAAQRRIGALLVNADGFFGNRRDQLTTPATRYRIPTSYVNREFVILGDLMSYGDDRRESLRQAGHYVGRILKGDKPADLPVMLPTKFELVINMKTAKALGLTFPLTLLARADEVIE